jgi:hypothetical protein
MKRSESVAAVDRELRIQPSSGTRAVPEYLGLLLLTTIMVLAGSAVGRDLGD